MRAKMCNEAKYYAWLKINENTPIEVKVHVLDMCMFNALLYGCEAWGEFAFAYNELRKIERKVLKAIMKVKSGTTNDLVFHELRRGDIVARIKDRQFNFYNKLKDLPPGDALVKNVLVLCKDLQIVSYYENLHDHNMIDDISDREKRIKSSTSSMMVYYVNLVSDEQCCIYNSYICDDIRYPITRWRLSNHDLKIETDRRRDIPREQRICDLCEVLEDEEHVIFVCPRYNEIRERHNELLEERSDIQLFLSPTYESVYEIATFICEVETLRE